MKTMLLDRTTWDLVLDAAGNIAVASEPYSLAQDAASAIMAYRGECFWDTTLGVPYLTQIFGKSPTVEQLKSLFVAAAMTVPDVSSAQCFITSSTNRRVSGQIQVRSASTGSAAAANFTVVNPQGPG